MASPNSIVDIEQAERRALHLSAAPAGFYLSPNESLQISSLASVATTITITGVMLDLDGTIRPVTFDHVANTNRTLATTTYKVGDGWLLQLTARVSSGSPITGQAWARVQVVRGDNAGAFVLATLGSRYVTAVQPIAWPSGDVRGTLEGQGAIRSITGTDPAAGSEITETVPTGARWRVLAIRTTLVTDATVINREPSLVLDDGTNIFARMPIGATMPASNTLPITFSRQSLRASATVSGDHNVPIAENVLPAGARVRTITANLQAGDNWGAPQLLVEEWLEGA